MPIYHLKPAVSELEDPAWATSTHQKECWVNAASEAAARGIASGKFQDGEATIPGHAGKPSPWRDARLVASAEVPPPDGAKIPENSVLYR